MQPKNSIPETSKKKYRMVKLPLIARSENPCAFERPIQSEKDGLYIMDRAVAAAQRVNFLGINYRPYWIMSDVAVICCIAYEVAFSKRFPEVSAPAIIVSTITSLAVYRIVLEVRFAFTGVATRSFLQDTLIYIIPVFLLAGSMLCQSLTQMCALVGTICPLYGGLARIGCFLGGCCYGRPIKWGVCYPDSLFYHVRHRWRRFSPSPNPRQRVLPVQLFEAFAQLAIFGLLTFLVWASELHGVNVLMSYFLAYSMARFFLDFFRSTSTRRRIGPLSQAQVVCIILALVTGAWYFAVGLE